MTYGEFVDAMREAAKINTEAEVEFERWVARASEEQWEEYRLLPLGEGEVLNFAEDMALAFQLMLSHTCGDELYEQRLKGGHHFLRVIHAKLVELGIEVELSRIDVPLTPSDSMVAAGLAEVTPQGGIKLTDEGQQMADAT